MLLIVFYLLPILALLFMFLVLLRGGMAKQADVAAFRTFVLVLIIWLSLLWVTDYLNHETNSLIFLRVALFIGSFAPVLFFWFCQRLVGSRSVKITIALFASAVTFALLSLTDYMVAEVQKGEVGVIIEQPTFIYILQTAYTALAFVFAFFWLRFKSSSNTRLRRQVRYITVAALTALSIGIIGGLGLVASGNLLSPIAITVFTAGSFMAIFRHGLFDIRLVVARSVAYLLSLSVITFIFSVLIFGFFGAVLESELPRGLQQLFYVVVTLSLVLIYQPLKHFFDHITNKLFYRDAYDPQMLLSKMNKLLISTYQLEKLLHTSANILDEHLKLQASSFIVKEHALEDGHKYILKQFGSSAHRLIEERELKVIDEYAINMHKQVLVTSDLNEKTDLYRLLYDNNISVLVKLIAKSPAVENIGYIALGNKKSGNDYSKQDTNIIAIIADELVLAIQNALRFEEIEHFNLTLQEKVDDATRKLRQTNEKLKALDETKDEFISMASHQLRTPLTSVKGYVSMVLEGDAGKITPQQRQLLDQAFVSSQRMVYLIADLLNVSRLKTGKFIIESVPTNLADVIEGEISQLVQTAKARKLELVYQKPNNFPVLGLDETKIRQVIMNFVDNAIYYTPSGGRIEVGLTDTGHSVEFTVKDNGIGIPKHEQPHLFNKFFRAGNARKARPDGTGLGLFMAKKVIVAQGGAVIFKSEEGKGSTFGFSFPKSKLQVSEK